MVCEPIAGGSADIQALAYVIAVKDHGKRFGGGGVTLYVYEVACLNVILFEHTAILCKDTTESHETTITA